MERFAIKIDKSLRANLYKICRLCGIDNPDKVKVLDDETIIHLEDGEPELWKKVLDCIGLLITKDDKMPQFMCTLCVDKINDFFEFREMCYATDGQTRKLLGIKEEPKLKISPVDCKTEEADIKQPLPTPQRSGRKRRNADQEICNTAKEIKADLTDDVKSTSANTNTTATKKKRLKMDISEGDTKPDFDIKPGASTSKATGVLKTGKAGPASKMGPASKVALQKKLLKVEPTASASAKEKKPNKVPKVLKRRVKSESPPLEPEIDQVNKSALPLQIQKKKKTLELLKQRKQLAAKKVAVVKVEKMRKSASESKIKEEAPVTALAASTPSLPKIKLKDKCTICDENFVNKVLLDKHIKVTHIPYIARYHCVHCNETLKKNMEIKNHNLWHKLSKTPFICGNCSESSCSIYTYSKHIRDCGQVAYIDAHVPDWHCPECNGVYETTYLFNIHSCVSNRLVCPGCDRSLKWKEDFIKHIPTCPAAVHRIPAYMSTTIQVKNEAELPTSPIPQNNSASGGSLQPTPTSRITAPLMDSNQCVVIPGNVSLIEEAPSPSPKGSVSKKGKRITKKDLKRFDKLLKSTMTTLVSIKQEPAHVEGGVENDGGESGGGDEDDTATADDEDAGMSTESPPRSPALADDDFHHNDDSDDCAEEQTTSLQPVGTIKQEIIDEGYRDLYNDIEVNIKREVVLNQIVRTEMSPAKKNSETANDVESTTPKPVLKLKITMEHGTLNSVLLDSPKSEKKKKKKKRKEEKHKATDKEDTPSVADEVHVSSVSNTLEDTQVPNVSNVVEDEPAMPLPGIVRIKQEIAEPEDIETDLPCQSSIPSIVAATSGSLQIASVSEGVQFGAAEENEEINETDAQDDANNWDYDEAQQPLDVKPSLDDLIPMLRIAAVSSAKDLIAKQVQPPAKRKRRSTSAKPSTSTPQIVSVSSMSGALHYQSEEKNPSEDGEEFCEKVDDNENIFDFMQVKIKEEVVESTYDEQSKISHEDENNGGNDDDADEQDDEEELETPVSKKQADENDYIANIDFNNLNIKQEKEYIDDGLVSTAAYQDDNTSDTETESSSDTDSDIDDTESEREYRELPENDAPLELQIAAVHSKFSPAQSDEKTESSHIVEQTSDLKITGQVAEKRQLDSGSEEGKDAIENSTQIDPAMDCEVMEMSKQPSEAVSIDSVMEMEQADSISSKAETTTLDNCSPSGTEEKSATPQAEKDLTESKQSVSKLNILCDPCLIANVPHEMEQTKSAQSVTEPKPSDALSSADTITQSPAQEVEMERALPGESVSDSNPLQDLSSIDTEAVFSPHEVEFQSGQKLGDSNPSDDLPRVDVEAARNRTKTSTDTEAESLQNEVNMELTEPSRSVFKSKLSNDPLLDFNKAADLRSDVEMEPTEPVDSVSKSSSSVDTAQESSRNDVDMKQTESANRLSMINSSNDLLAIPNETGSSTYEVEIEQPGLSRNVSSYGISAISVEAECLQLNPSVDSEAEALRNVVEMEVTEAVESVSKSKTLNQNSAIDTEAGSSQNDVEMGLTELGNTVAKSSNDHLLAKRATESSSLEEEIEHDVLQHSVVETKLPYEAECCKSNPTTDLPSIDTEPEYSQNDVEMQQSVSINSISRSNSANDLLQTDTKAEAEMDTEESDSYVIESKSSQDISIINAEPSAHPLEMNLYGPDVSSARLSDSLTDTIRPLGDIEQSCMDDMQLPSTTNQACMTTHEPMEQVQSHLDISTLIHKNDHIPSSLVTQDLADPSAVHSVDETSFVSSMAEPNIAELLKCDRDTKPDEASPIDDSNMVSANIVQQMQANLESSSRLADVNMVSPTYVADIQTYSLPGSTTQETTTCLLINQTPPLQPTQCDDDITMSEVDPIVSEIEGLIHESPSHMSLHPPGDVREINKLSDEDPSTESTFRSLTAMDDRTRSAEEPPVSICVSDRVQGAPIESVSDRPQDSFNILTSYDNTFEEQQPALPMPQTTSALQDILPDVMSQVPVVVPPSECTSEFNPTNTNLTDISCSSIQISNTLDSPAELTTSTAGQLLSPPDVSNLLPTSSDLSIPVLTEEVQNILNEDTVAANQFQLNDTILQAAQCSTSSSSSMYPQFPPRPPAVLIPPLLRNFTDFENVNEIAENNNNANIERELQDELGNVLAAAIANDEVDDNNS